MKGEHIGEFEELVLLSVYRLGDEAYGVSVQQVLENEAGRRASLGSVYSALERLERKAYLASSVGGATRERGGRRKRYFSMTPAGVEALERVRAVRDALWRKAGTADAGSE